ncbi:MAG: alpha-2-macroglobulin [Clostridiaceae bacterium]|mgnify:CR=1 FL=1|nr:alpha-2-macroglobulin [Clostridiaceae bacterium]
MWKKALSYILILSFFVSVIWFANPVTPAAAYSENFKDGFLVTPEKEDETGVALDSGFILTSEMDLTLDYVREIVSVRDIEVLNITQITNRKFLIKPVEPLKQNKVYYIDIRTASNDTVTFAFQTKRDFVVLGTLPADTSNNVPLDTGIEIYFSYPDVENIENFFEISPKVEGRFENYGYTTVFIPENKLQPETIYEIIIKKGLTAANGLVALEKDYVFAFETSPDSKSTAHPYPGYLSFSDNWNEFETGEKPVVPFNIHLNSNPESVDVKLTVFEFKTIHEFIKAIKENEKVPSWAAYSRRKAMVDSSNLEKVLEFSQNFNLKVWQSRNMMFPEALPHGFYLLELSCDDMKAQAFMQISDISAYTISDKDQTLIWLNDIKTGKVVPSANIFDHITEKSAKTDKDGIAVLPTAFADNNTEDFRLLLYEVTTSDQKKSLINAGYIYGPAYIDSPSGGLYWRYLQTDRTLYKPYDTVEFWGFIKSRTDEATPRKVTVELLQGGYYPMRGAGSFFMPFMSNSLETLTLNTENGFFEGSLKLPDLDPGSYNLQVKDGDKVISSTYFSVENYVKPQYKLEISGNKNAVFTGEEIVFEIKASFFEGIPVSNIPVRYSIYGHGNTKTETGITDENGILKVEYTPEYVESMQGQHYYNINVNAEFPETGSITASYGFRVFANDIAFTSKGEIKDDRGIVTITVNEVELNTLNDEDPQNDTYIGKPINSQKLSLSIEHIIWEKIETGTEYDPINKVVRKLYDYREKSVPVAKAYLLTDNKGVARFQFNVVSENEGYYVVKITTQDRNGRNMKGETWIYNNNLEIIQTPSSYEYYTLKPDKEAYRADEPVNVKVLKNNEEPLRDMRTLFVQARNGIQSYTVKAQPELTQTFPESFAPNYYLQGIVFNGKGYINTSTNIRYDYEEKRINLEIKTDRESYKPGDNITLSIGATDIDGSHVPAKVNLSMIDEALLSLSDQYIDPLSELYSWIGSGIIRSTYTRRSSRGSMGMETGNAATQDMAPAPDPVAGVAEKGAGSRQIRSDFRDTALFKTISLDKDGSGVFTFRLPDNITSFRLTAAAVSEDLLAGSETESVKVSMPFFINDAMSLDYLAGDKPYIGLGAYGEELKSDQTVTFEVTINELPQYKETADAKAFERVNVKLPELMEGSYTITVKAVSESGLTDALSRTINVHSSFRTVEKAVIKKLKANMKLEGGKSGLTTLIFADAGRGSLINSLHRLAWQYGNRLDQKLTSNFARNLLKEIINNEEYNIELLDINYPDYKTKDGGYGILPYVDSDLRFTALVTPLLKDKVDKNSLKLYFYNELLSDNSIKAPALFALAELGEPVLVELNRAAAVQNLKLDDYLFIALAYETMGDISKAQDIYINKIRPNLEAKAPYMRVKAENGDVDTIYSLTALTAVLAARLDNPDAESLYEYVENNCSKTQYTGVEKVLYLAEMSKKLSDEKASFEYSFEAGTRKTADISDGHCEVIKIPSTKIDTLKILKVNGDIDVLSLYTAPYTDAAENDPHITVSRKYFNAATGKETNTFKPNDIVKVEIHYNIDKAAIDNMYEIRDYAPAGLKPLSNPWSYGVGENLGCWYRNIEGQEVTFVVGKNQKEIKPLVYYARVASPGEYIAEGTVVQGSTVKSSMVTLENSRIIIEP